MQLGLAVPPQVQSAGVTQGPAFGAAPQQLNFGGLLSIKPLSTVLAQEEAAAKASLAAQQSDPVVLNLAGLIRRHFDLAQQAKIDIGESREYLFLLLDMSRHNDCGVIDNVKTGRTCSAQKNINAAFMEAVLNAVASDDDDSDPSTTILDLTCEESLEASG